MQQLAGHHVLANRIFFALVHVRILLRWSRVQFEASRMGCDLLNVHMCQVATAAYLAAGPTDPQLLRCTIFREYFTDVAFNALLLAFQTQLQSWSMTMMLPVADLPTSASTDMRIRTLKCYIKKQFESQAFHFTVLESSEFISRWTPKLSIVFIPRSSEHNTDEPVLLPNSV